MDDDWEHIDECPFRLLRIKPAAGARAVMRAWRKRMRAPHADAARLTAAKDRILRERRNAVATLEDEWLHVIREPIESVGMRGAIEPVGMRGAIEPVAILGAMFKNWTIISSPAHAGTAPRTPPAARAPPRAPPGTPVF